MNYKKLVNSIKSINQTKIIDEELDSSLYDFVNTLISNWEGSDDQKSELEELISNVEIQGRDITNNEIKINVDDLDNLKIAKFMCGRSANFKFNCLKIGKTSNFDPSKQSIGFANETCTAVNGWAIGKAMYGSILPGDWTLEFKNSVLINENEYVLLSLTDGKFTPLKTDSAEEVRNQFLSDN